MKMVKLVPALSNRGDQPSRRQYIEMLRDCLSCQPHLVLHSQTCAQLEQRLAVSVDQFVKNRAADWSSDRLEDIAHRLIIGKRALACQPE